MDRNVKIDYVSIIAGSTGGERRLMEVNVKIIGFADRMVDVERVLDTQLLGEFEIDHRGTVGKVFHTGPVTG